MKAAVYYNNKDVRIQDLDVPKINSKEILVKVNSSGICGSDVMEWYRIKKAPRILGHEIAGVIEKVGSAVQNFKPGQRVFVSHHVPCMECRLCKTDHQTACSTLHSTNFDPGGFSEYIRVPEINVKNGVFLIPENISDDDATFIEPLACCIRGQKRSLMKKDDTVLVLGSGISGILHIKLAKAMGAKKVYATDINDRRLEWAAKFGASPINAKDDVKKMIADDKIDLAIVATGAPDAFKQAFECAGTGGTVLIFAPAKPDIMIPLDTWNLWVKDITIRTSYAGSPADIKDAIELLRNKKINVAELITHILPISQIQKGFDLVAKAEDSVKVIIKPNGL